MQPRRVEVWSLPDDPGGFRSLLELEIVNWDAQDPDDTPGKGSVSLDPDSEFLDDILTADPTDVAASSSALICLFGEHDPDVPDFEFFADQRVDPIGPGLTTISGPDIRAGLNDGKVHPRAPGDPIWLWGQPPITRNSDLTEGLIADEEFDVWITGGIAGDTWRIDLGATGWSSAIDYDATNADVKAAIEAGPSSVVEVNVTGSGADTDPWKIHIVNPAQTDYSVQVDDADVTGAIFVRFVYDGGEVKPTYYTPAQTVEGVLFGVQGTFRVENDPLDGLPSILIAGNSAFIGAQQILSGVAGIHGYATVEIRPLIYGANFRLGIRDIDEAWLYTVEDFIAEGVGYVTLTIPTVEIPTIIDQIILRGAVIDDAPPDFYLRNLKFHRGMPGTTWGDITLQLVGAAQTRGVLAWLDTSGITEALDFNGNAWDNASLEFRADPGMDLGTHVMADGRDMGYEYDIVRLATPVGALTHELRVWNRGGRGAVKTVDPAIIVGDITTGSIAKRRLPFTHLLVEYGTLQFTEVTHVDFAGLPRREGFIRAEQATDEATAIQIGETYILDQIDDILATQIDSTSVDPYSDADIGDTIPYELGRHAGRHSRRIHTIATKYSNEVWSAEFTASQLFATEKAAQWEAIRRLQEAFDRKNFNREAAAVLPQLVGGGRTQVTEVIIAASDTHDDLKELADYVCIGAADQDTWRTMFVDLGAVSLRTGAKGRVKVLSGTYEFSDRLQFDLYTGYVQIVGEGLPVIRMGFDHVYLADGSGFCALIGNSGASHSLNHPISWENIHFDGQNNGICFFQNGAVTQPWMDVHNCYFSNFTQPLWWSERTCPRFFHHNRIFNCAFTTAPPIGSAAAFGFGSTTVGPSIIHDNVWDNCSGNMVAGGPYGFHALFDRNIQYSGGTMVLNALGGVTYNNNHGF